MLAIRMQRTGRKGHAQFRIIVQESRRTPTSGAVVAQLGHYNPHDKQAVVNLEKANFYLEHGAQPSDRVARLFQKEGIKLPSWVKLTADKARSTRHAEKLRKNQPAPEVVAEVPATEPAESAPEKPAETATATEEAATTPEAEVPEATATDTTPEETVEESAKDSAK